MLGRLLRDPAAWGLPPRTATGHSRRVGFWRGGGGAGTPSWGPPRVANSYGKLLTNPFRPPREGATQEWRATAALTMLYVQVHGQLLNTPEPSHTSAQVHENLLDRKDPGNQTVVNMPARDSGAQSRLGTRGSLNRGSRSEVPAASSANITG